MFSFPCLTLTLTGQYASVPGAYSCRTCATGQYSLSGWSTCVTCPAGNACPTGVLQPCTAGRWSAAGWTSCVSCNSGWTSGAGAAFCCPLYNGGLTVRASTFVDDGSEGASSCLLQFQLGLPSQDAATVVCTMDMHPEAHNPTFAQVVPAPSGSGLFSAISELLLSNSQSCNYGTQQAYRGAAATSDGVWSWVDGTT